MMLRAIDLRNMHVIQRGIASRGVWGVWAAIALAVGACGGDARVELSAADALSAVAGQMSNTIDEYHQEVSQHDDTRETSVVAAFVARVRSQPADEAAVDAHVVDFETALRKIRADRETEWARRAAAMDNVSLLREVGKGLQKIAIQSLSLQDEMRRYLEGWIQMRQRADQEIRTAGAANVRAEK